MRLREVLQNNHVSAYQLSKKSGVPYMTINDICNGKTDLAKSSAETVFRLAEALDMSMEQLLEDYLNKRSSFELFKSNTCHRLKEQGDFAFLTETLESDQVRKLYEKKWFPESFYLLALVDYLCKENGIDICKDYEELRVQKLDRVLYPAGILAYSSSERFEEIKELAKSTSIPEFMRHNIVEGEVRDVV